MDKTQHSMTYSGGANDLHEYWEEYQKMIEETKLLDDYLEEECSPKSYDEGEEEAEWLKAAGLGELTETWKAGREIQADELGIVLRPLSRAQAEAVKRRVRSLNHTVKQRFNQRTRARKPDIRDVFKDVEDNALQISSTGTRSRSATPDSLDSMSGETPESTSPPSPPNSTRESHYSNVNVPSFVSIFQRNSNDDKERRSNNTLQVQELFRRNGHHWSHRGDIASDSEGIELTAYQRLGTIHVSRPINQRCSTSDPSEVGNNQDLNIKSSNKLSDDYIKDKILRRSGNNHTPVTRSHSSLYGSSRIRENLMITHPLNRTSSHGHLSFEQMCRANESTAESWNDRKVGDKNAHDDDDDDDEDDDYQRQRVELLSQRDITRLQPLLWLELTAVFDKYNLPLIKRKPNKRRRKAGNLFGVSLSTLLLRDSQLTNEENNIPIIFEKLINELTRRGVKEEGILRVGGNKQKIELLCTELETDFYSKPKDIDKLIQRTPCHDLSAALKKLLRDLPQPLLTIEYIDAFYQSHGVKNPTDLSYSLNLLVLLLPVEHRSTLKSLLKFFKLVIDNQCSNKMSIHNVAMIIAPSLFPPRYIYPRDRSDLSAQVNMAAVCCQVTEALLNNIDKLWDVPSCLINQLRRQIEEERYRKYKKK